MTDCFLGWRSHGKSLFKSLLMNGLSVEREAVLELQQKCRPRASNDGGDDRGWGTCAKKRASGRV